MRDCSARRNRLRSRLLVGTDGRCPLTVPLASHYAEVSEPDRMKEWLGETLRIRTASENKSMRFDGPREEGIAAIDSHWIAALDRLNKKVEA